MTDGVGDGGEWREPDFRRRKKWLRRRSTRLGGERGGASVNKRPSVQAGDEGCPPCDCGWANGVAGGVRGVRGERGERSVRSERVERGVCSGLGAW